MAKENFAGKTAVLTLATGKTTAVMDREDSLTPMEAPTKAVFSITKRKAKASSLTPTVRFTKATGSTMSQRAMAFLSGKMAKGTRDNGWQARNMVLGLCFSRTVASIKGSLVLTKSTGEVTTTGSILKNIAGAGNTTKCQAQAPSLGTTAMSTKAPS